MDVERDIEYWNEMAEKSAPSGTNLVSVNYFKIPRLMKHILEYNFVNKRVIEVGVGLGITAFALHILYSKRLMKYTGTDISDKFISTAKRLHHLDIINTPADNLPAEDGEVDFILALDVLEHISPDNRELVAKEFSRVLKPLKGRLLINNPLNISMHDEEFEYYLTTDDLAQFEKWMDGTLERLTVYSANGLYYQFISIVRNGE